MMPLKGPGAIRCAPECREFIIEQHPLAPRCGRYGRLRKGLTETAPRLTAQP